MATALKDATDNMAEKTEKIIALREKLINARDNAYLSQKLAKIRTEVPLDMSLNDLSIKQRDNVGLYKKFTELELNSLISKLGLTGSPSSVN